MKAPKIVVQTHCGVEVDWNKVLKSKNLYLYFFPEIPFDNVSIVSQEAYLFKNYFVRFDLSHNEVLGITDDKSDITKTFIQRFGIPFHFVYDRDHQIAKNFKEVLGDGDTLTRTLVRIQKGGTVKGVYQGAEIEKTIKRIVQFTQLPWYKKLFKKPF